MRNRPSLKRLSAVVPGLALAGGLVYAGASTLPDDDRSPAALASSTRPLAGLVDEGGTDGARPARAERASRGADGVWARLRSCESGGRYDANTGNGFYGAYQFVPATWRSLGYSGLPHQADPATQDEAARKLQARSGWGQWPACSRALGLR